LLSLLAQIALYALEGSNPVRAMKVIRGKRKEPAAAPFAVSSS
jgi:hypothetical protein